MSVIDRKQRYGSFSPSLCEFCGPVISRQLEILLDKAHRTFRAHKKRVSERAPSNTHHCALCTYVLSMLQDETASFAEGEVFNTYITHAVCLPYDSERNWVELRIYGESQYKSDAKEDVEVNVTLCCQVQDAITDLPIWVSSTSLEPVKQLASAKRWLKNCQENHEECKASEASLHASCPTRLLDISQSAVRLVYPPPYSNVGYAALSHCWGGGLPIKTTQNNLQEHLLAIQMETLPKTYRDAIAISRELGIHYLWIDSLCIVQDDAQDWEREAAMMASVYEGAVVTIVASWGKNGDSGCFYAPRPSLSIEVHEENSGNENDLPSMRLYLRPRPDPARYLANSHLSTRSWTFQEVTLARRVLIFTDEQLYWQCTSILESEDGLESSDHSLGFSTPLPYLGVAIRQPDTLHWDLYHSWEIATQAYSKRSLSFSSDKFAALAGITQLFQRATGDIPLAGLWKSNICQGLLWSNAPSAHGKLDAEAIEALNIPSWSWAKLRSPIEYHFGGEQPSTEITDASVTWTGVPLISKIHQASISGVGKLAQLAEFCVQDRRAQCMCRASQYLARFDYKYTEYHRLYAYLDECSQDFKEPLTCLVLYTDVRRYPRHLEAEVLSLSTLLLTAVQDSQSTCTYRRVGVGLFNEVPRAVFDNFLEAGFTLV